MTSDGDVGDGNCRTAGSQRGKVWSTVKTHGWFSYDMKVKAGVENTITITGKGEGGVLSFDLTIDGVTTRHSVSKDGKVAIKHSFVAKPGVDKVTVKIERNSAYMPFIYSVVMN